MKRTCQLQDHSLDCIQRKCNHCAIQDQHAEAHHAQTQHPVHHGGPALRAGVAFPRQPGFEERLTTDIYPADFGWVADWAEGEFSFYSPGHNLSTVDESGACYRSLQLDYDEEVEAKD